MAVKSNPMPSTGALKLNNTVYDTAKEATTLWLPGLATLYVAVSGYWDLPRPTEVSGTILAIVTFLGLVLKISTSSYNNGKLNNPDNAAAPVVVAQVVEAQPANPDEFPDLQR